MAIAQLEWLIGSWHNSSAEGDASEIWKKQSDSVYAGQSFFVAGKDTVSSEKLRIEQRGNDLFYIPTVSNQNGGKPVEFKLTGKKGEQWIFENPGHDFPTKISYTRIGADSVLAEISGLMDGKPSSQQFPMKKSD